MIVEEGIDFDKVVKGVYVVYENVLDFDIILIVIGLEVNFVVLAVKELVS